MGKAVKTEMDSNKEGGMRKMIMKEMNAWWSGKAIITEMDAVGEDGMGKRINYNVRINKTWMTCLM